MYAAPALPFEDLAQVVAAQRAVLRAMAKPLLALDLDRSAAD